MKKLLFSTLLLSLLAGSNVCADDLKGSIKIGLFGSEKEAMHKVTVNMVQAIEAAKKTVEGRVVKAKLDEEDDYLVYEIEIIDKKDKETKVLVDPVTAKVLKSEEDD